ncbi:MAG: DUF4431 domain-containing protein [Formivibrio sp.]|nr:DUF4431 domain-containing protein [Formivibrio sp.]
MKNVRKNFILCAIISIYFLPAHAACLGYDPEKVNLQGKLVRETYPGPPNFESVKDGDEPETGYYLHLGKSICVRDKNNQELSSYDHVKNVQLILSAKQYKQLRPRLGKQVTLGGMLWDGNTGHYHAPVGFKVKKLISKKLIIK